MLNVQLIRGILLAAAAILLSAAVVATQDASQDSASDGSAGAIIAMVVYLAIGAAIAYFMWRNRRPFSLQHQTTAAADQIVMTAIQQYTMNGWAVTSQSPMNATFERRLTGSCLLALPLLLLGILLLKKQE